MRGTPAAGPDLGVYAKAVVLLVRNPSIVVIPLLMAVIGVLLRQVLAPMGGGFMGSTTAGLAGFFLLVLELFGLGAACVLADDAWRHGRASFDRGWSEAQRRGSDLLTAALGVAIITSLGQFAGLLVGVWIGLLITLVTVVFLIWAMPAAAVGGIPGAAAIQASIERVRAMPVAAVLTAIVAVLLVYLAVPFVASYLTLALLPYIGGLTIVEQLIFALLKAVAIGYVALIVTKTYTDGAFTRRW